MYLLFKGNDKAASNQKQWVMTYILQSQQSQFQEGFRNRYKETVLGRGGVFLVSSELKSLSLPWVPILGDGVFLSSSGLKSFMRSSNLGGVGVLFIQVPLKRATALQNLSHTTYVETNNS